MKKLSTSIMENLGEVTKLENGENKELATVGKGEKPAVFSRRAFGCSINEWQFIMNYKKTGGNATRSVLMYKPYLQEDSACTEGYRMLGLDRVKSAIKAQLALETSPDNITSWFANFRDEAKSEEVRLKSNRSLAEIAGMFGNSKGATVNSAQVVINLPSDLNVKKSEPIDVSYSEKH